MPDFRRRFMDWAATRAPGSSHDEGLAFGRSLGQELPAAARVERVLAGQGRFARDADGVVVRIPVFGPRRYRAPWGHEPLHRRHR